MRNLQMQIKHLLLLSSFIVFLMPHPAQADGEKGKLQIQRDRILKGTNEEQSPNVTELDLLFPDLFGEEVKEKVEAEQAKKEASYTDVKTALFSEKIKTEPMKVQVRNRLFSDEYEAPFSSRRTEEPEKEATTLSGVLFYGSIVTVLGMIGAGMLFLLRSF